MFTVRKTTSGYNGISKYLVFNGSRRVSVHAFGTKEAAQASADELNIEALVKDYDTDPRPYLARLEEARAQFERLQETRESGTCPGCGGNFKGARGLRVHQSGKFVAAACKTNK